MSGEATVAASQTAKSEALSMIVSGENALEGEFKTIMNNTIVRLRHTLDSVRSHRDLDTEEDAAAVTKALEDALAGADAVLVDRAVAREAVAQLRLSAAAERKLEAPVPDFAAMFKKLQAMARSKASSLVAADPMLKRWRDEVQRMRAALNAEDGDVQMQGGSSEGKFVCQITKGKMEKPLRTPCGHVFSEAGLKLISQNKPLFRCPQVRACVRVCVCRWP